jgi:hypothetical protein
MTTVILTNLSKCPLPICLGASGIGTLNGCRPFVLRLGLDLPLGRCLRHYPRLPSGSRSRARTNSYTLAARLIPSSFADLPRSGAI